MSGPTKLKYVARISVSSVDKKTVDGETPVRLCNYTDVYYNDRITDDLAFMSATASPAEMLDFSLAPGDVLITKDSETPEDIAVPALVESVTADVLCGYHLAMIRPDQRLLEPRFLFWTLASRPAREWFGAQATGVTRFGLRAQSVSDFEISLPPMGVQRRIADLLDAEAVRISALTARIGKEIDLLHERQKALITEAVTGQLDVARADVA